MTLFGTMIGIIGWRSIRHAIHIIKPPPPRRIPLVLHEAAIISKRSRCTVSSSSSIFHPHLEESRSTANEGTSTSPTKINHARNRVTITSLRRRHSKTSSHGNNNHGKWNHIETTTLQRRYFWTWPSRGGGDGDDKSSKKTGGGGWSFDIPISLSEPDIEMDIKQHAAGPSTSSKYLKYPYSYCTAQGYRTYMEDEFFISKDAEFCAVFDGHGGGSVSKYLKSNLYAGVQAFLPILKTTTKTDNNALDPSVTDYENAIRSAFDKVDREVQRISHWSYQGSTAVAIWLHEDRSSTIAGDSDDDQDENSKIAPPRRTIIAANVGDSRAVLSRNGTAWELTRDHKPNDPDEKARIESMGGKVVWCGDIDSQGEPIYETGGIFRVNGNLALSRAIGDRAERPHVSAEPEIVSVKVDEECDEFFVVATDGLWDVMSSQDSVDLVKTFLEAGCKTHQISKLIVEEAIRRGTYDNVTVVIVWL